MKNLKYIILTFLSTSFFINAIDVNNSFIDINNSTITIDKNGTNLISKSFNNNQNLTVNIVNDELGKNSEQFIIEQHKLTREHNNRTAIATLETLFPLVSGRDVDVDSTIVHLKRYERRTQIFSYDHSKPMILFWGDEFKYFIYGSCTSKRSIPLYLIVEGRDSRQKFLLLNNHKLNSILIPSSSPEPLKVYIENEYGLSDCHIKIMIKSTGRERSRDDFKRILLQTTLSDTARKYFKETSVRGLRLREKPKLSSNILRHLRKGTIFKIIKERNNWLYIRLPEGRNGWISKKYIQNIE